MDETSIRSILEWFSNRVGDAIKNDLYQILLLELANLMFERENIPYQFKSTEEVIIYIMSGRRPLNRRDVDGLGTHSGFDL